MSTSSIHFQRADYTFAEIHNSRQTERQPSYLLPEDKRQQNDFIKLEDVKTLHEKQMEYRRLTHARGRSPTLTDSYWEAVVNLNSEHTIDDVRRVAEHIRQKFKFTPTSISIHRDEGYVDKITGETKYNYHAHLTFYTIAQGRSQMRLMTRAKLRDLQTEVADILHMERGQQHSQAKRLDHQQYRQVAQQKQVLNDKINGTQASVDVLQNILDIYIKSFEIKSNGIQILSDIYAKATELKELKVNKEQQLKQIELLKKKRGVLNKGAKNYRQQKKNLKQQITKLNNDITNLNKTIQSLQADKTDLQGQLDDAKGQIISLQNQAPKVVTKTITNTVTKTETKLRDYSDEEKQKLIETAIATKIQNGELFTKDQYDNKPLTQKQIKDYIEQNRQAMRQQGIYTASDYKQLSQLKADLISELKLTKAGELQLTEEQVISRIKTLMTNLTAAETDLETVKADLVTENLKNKYNELPSHSQKSSITPQKHSQSDESTIKRVEVPHTSQSQSMSVLEQKTAEDKKYEIVIGNNACLMAAQDIHDWLEDYPEEKDSIAKQLSEADRREVFREPKQTPSRVSHGLHR